jgi:hypothetical protein
MMETTQTQTAERLSSVVHVVDVEDQTMAMGSKPTSPIHYSTLRKREPLLGTGTTAGATKRSKSMTAIISGGRYESADDFKDAIRAALTKNEMATKPAPRNNKLRKKLRKYGPRITICVAFILMAYAFRWWYYGVHNWVLTTRPHDMAKAKEIPIYLDSKQYVPLARGMLLNTVASTFFNKLLSGWWNPSNDQKNNVNTTSLSVSNYNTMNEYTKNAARCTYLSISDEYSGSFSVHFNKTHLYSLDIKSLLLFQSHVLQREVGALSFITPSMYLPVRDTMKTTPCLCSITDSNGEYVRHMFNMQVDKSNSHQNNNKVQERLLFIQEKQTPYWKEIPKEITVNYKDWTTKATQKRTFTGKDVNLIQNCLFFMNDYRGDK